MPRGLRHGCKAARRRRRSSEDDSAFAISDASEPDVSRRFGSRERAASDLRAGAATGDHGGDAWADVDCRRCGVGWMA